MVVFLFRPSPQVPEPSVRAAQQCFEASRFNIYVQFEQVKTRSVDLTWIFTQSLFMALNTLLWTISYPSIRHDHPKPELELHLRTALEAMHLASLKWPGVAPALELYSTLAEACMTAYEGDSMVKYGARSSKDPTPSDIGTIPAQMSASFTADGSPTSRYNGVLSESSHGRRIETQVQVATDGPGVDSLFLQHSIPPSSSLPAATYSLGPEPSQQLSFDLSAYSNPLPQPLSYNPTASHTEGAIDRSLFFGTFGDPYTQILHAEYVNPGPITGLSLEQQSELMHNLEASRVGGQLRETSPRQTLRAVGQVQ